MRPRTRAATAARFSLRYTVQYLDGKRWHTIKTFEPDDEFLLKRSDAGYDGEDGGFKLACKFSELAARKVKKPVRVLLMPENFLAVQFPNA
jgi:hypothetical protein